MKGNNWFTIGCTILVFLSISLTVACQNSLTSNTAHSQGDFQIHLIKLSHRYKDLDILSDPDYIIMDDQISTYDWSQQMIVFDDSVLEIYIGDVEYLGDMSVFAIIWNGEVVAEGEIIDIGSPVLVSHPVMHVLEPVGDPQFTESSYRLFRGFHPDFGDIEDLSILLRTERTNDPPKKKLNLVFDDKVAKEIKSYFKQDGKLINSEEIDRFLAPPLE